jgi:hypothetical protein
MDQKSKDYITDRLRDAFWRAGRAGNLEIAADLDVLIAKVRGRGMRDEAMPVEHAVPASELTGMWLFDFHTQEPLRPATRGEVRYWDTCVRKARSRWFLVEEGDGPRAVTVENAGALASSAVRP